LSSNEWQLTEKIVILLEPMQYITKELSCKGAMVSPVIPCLEILKMELNLSEPESAEKCKGILTTEDEILSSLDSRFEHVYTNDTYLLATLFDPRFKNQFYDEETTQSIITQVCESDSELLTDREGHQQDDESQGQSCPSNVTCNSQLGSSESDSVQSITTTATNSVEVTRKKGLVCMILTKELSKTMSRYLLQHLLLTLKIKYQP